MKNKLIIFLFVMSSCATNVNGQQPDSIIYFSRTMHVDSDYTAPQKCSLHTQRLTSLILPIAFITYGVVSLSNHHLKSLDNEIKEEIWTDHPHSRITIDNYLQYAPAAMVYGLNAAGIKGKNNFRDRTMIYLMSNAMMGIVVQSTKAITKVQRPDGYGTNAFPSGHTATAFAAAEFLREEYGQDSPWYGFAGYAMATTTAYLRMYNNKHWFRDLLPGAGIGILSTKASYWIYPSIKKMLFKEKPTRTIIMPYYQSGGGGLALVYNMP